MSYLNKWIYNEAQTRFHEYYFCTSIPGDLHWKSSYCAWTIYYMDKVWKLDYCHMGDRQEANQKFIDKEPPLTPYLRKRIINDVFERIPW